MPAVRLTLGPVLFNWSAERLAAFYRDVAAAGVFDRVHVGEVVCGKRAPFTDAIWPEVIAGLEAAGIEVVLSTLALPSTPRERASVAATAGDDRLIEIDDVTALPARAGRPFVAGPLLNVYNEGAAAFLAARGAVTLCLPVELPLAAAGAIAAACPGVEVELFAFGRLPLALSGRCYHARLAGLAKDSCRFVCERDPDGLAVDTLEGRPFLAANGVQTLSHGVHAFLPTAAEAEAAGIRRLRLSPHTVDMAAVGRLYRAVLDGTTERAEALGALSAMALPGDLVDGYVRGARGCAPVAAA
ncbi:ubiquinone anaerobic biosynthesis protein UbiV [Oharaeibacter diazotrophicus]|uniref:Ubiquinone biosynthesis protein UbiV n=1 Tax=Oharaeibacter diazotrophicus TaxID=1920512 RepID=A0A4R6R4U7_9HYPH|nr:U32 family peptidase [Oharaeibacter diazotrophicus]TDP80921.1 collagenase-like PrtC family protease [Oharaeibacter diazotrophicus]BBE73816.1 peptidase family U32 [Pleomorphomonas sp. SM30]GLS74700.1 U32 family peptidase [Oharaeibacter diazotrophicus]